MNTLICFCVGALAAVISEIFWKGESRRQVALWGGLGILLLRRVVLRFSTVSRALLCVLGALLLTALRFALYILQSLPLHADRKPMVYPQLDMPSFSYGLYRFLLIAPAYAIIEYLESCFGV